MFFKILKGGFLKHIPKALLVLLTTVCLAFLVSGFDFGNLTTSFYCVKDYRIQEPIRIIVLSDLHLREFGKDNYKLIDRVKALNPDLIAVPGDIVIAKNPKHEKATKLLNELSNIAPVYFSYGNHEYYDILFTKGSRLRTELQSTKAEILNKTYKKINVKGSDIVIGGFCVSPKDFDEQHSKFLEDFCSQEGYKILLCHHVECFEEVMKDYPVDLALTGHAHGGQFVLPEIGAVYAPDQGFFPKLTEGMHNLCDSTVIISRGLGNSKFIPRYNNDPEIVVVDISNR